MVKTDPKAFVTNETLDKKLGEVVDVILTGMDNLIEDQNKHIDQRFDKVDKRLDKVESEIVWIKDDVRGLKADFFNVPSRKEFSELKGKVDKYLTP